MNAWHHCKQAHCRDFVTSLAKPWVPVLAWADGQMVARKENWPEMSGFVIITGEMTPGNPISTLNQAAPTGDSESETFKPTSQSDNQCSHLFTQLFTIWLNWKIIECSLISYQTAAGVGCLESVGVSLILWSICFKSFEIRQRLREPSSLLVFSKEQVTQPMQWQGHLQIRADVLGQIEIFQFASTFSVEWGDWTIGLPADDPLVTMSHPFSRKLESLKAWLQSYNGRCLNIKR